MELYAPAALTAASIPRQAGAGSASDAARMDDMQLRHACREFESVLYASMLKSMRGAIPKTELIHGGSAEDIFTAMLDEEYARLLSHSEQSRFSQALYDQLRPEREEAARPAGAAANTVDGSEYRLGGADHA
jgi:flagellar protein FlgJ